MATEIELKYFVHTPDVSNKIDQLLTQLNAEYLVKHKQVFNCYFDTEAHRLRQMDMGLRVRKVDDYREQTIKTTGKLVGSLHVRPEYNVAIEQDTPNLSLFDDEIWPENTDLNELQQQLQPLFETDFHRQTWLITFNNDSCVELAYDQGLIKAGEQQQEINELELELVRGNPQQLLQIAEQLVAHLQLQPGVHSKAARGYRLAQNTEQKPVLEQLTLLPTSAEDSLGHSFFNGLSFSLHQLQLMLDYYIETESLVYLTKVTEMLAMIRHGFWLYQEILPSEAQPLREQLSQQMKQLAWVDEATHVKELMDKTGNYRKKLEYSEQLLTQLKQERNELPSYHQTVALLTSTEFNLLQLNLLAFVLNEKSMMQQSAESEISLLSFARQKLQESLDAVMYLNDEQALSCEQYLSQYKLLIRSLLSGSWFARLFPEESRKPYRACWLDIKQGINELQTLWIIKQQLDALDDPEKKLTAWLDSKISSLLVALEHTRAFGNSLKVYW